MRPRSRRLRTSGTCSKHPDSARLATDMRLARLRSRRATGPLGALAVVALVLVGLALGPGGVYPRPAPLLVNCGGYLYPDGHCGPLPMYPSPPALGVVTLHQSGYWDVPCTDPPSSCATPVAPDPSALAQARPLRIAALEVPVGPVGHRAVEIGRAVLPNGILSEATFALADSLEGGFTLEPNVVRMEFRSTDSTRPPFTNVYVRGRFHGVEEVRVLLVFDVAATSGDRVIHVRDVDIH